ncbi:RHS repeat domain-containing protein [Pseudomonas moorei]|uniref:RHS repeat domain-containing protein n=1 Tax=Pseudomonas moorei TaxID=395599 RepID=UPI00200E236A|nr:RHS repeat-associated core domain-containing protein [Pseudomonas moorei]
MNSALAGETVLQTTERFTGFDGVEKTMARQDSLITGESVLTTDPNGVQLLRQFDALGRVTREIVSPAFPDARAERVYTYVLTSTDGQQASQSVVEANGATTLTRYDGLGRTIDKAFAEDSQALRQIFSAKYDALGNRAEETRYDWLEEKRLTLRQQFEYDAWGVACRTTQPDGSVSNLMWSPFGKNGPVEYSWLETPGAQETITISGLTGGEYNTFGKLDRSEQLDAQPLIERCRQQPQSTVVEHLRQMLRDAALPTVGAVQYLYDGNSNCVQQTALFDKQEHSTYFAYDAWNRVHSTTLADNTVVGREFAEQSMGQQVTRMKVKPGNSAQPEVTVGRQKFDSLLRLTEVSVGPEDTPRVEQYRYTGGQMQPSKRITALETFEFEYKPELSQQPLSIKAGADELSTFSYDLKTGGIIKASNNQGYRTYRYTTSGQLTHESWTDTDGTALETEYTSSLLGRQITRRDSGGLETLYTYDEYGRASSVTQGSLKAEFEYNALGQLQRTTTRNLNLVMAVTLVADVQYDTLGREVERILSVSDQPTRTITQTWQGDNQLKSRQLSVGGSRLLTEEFVYDQRNRLVHHKCTGASKALPRDAYGNAIKSQLFNFDGLDNMTRVVTEFDNGLSDVARLIYATNDPCQLIQITHTYTDGGYAPTQSFEYDANGHMLNDEQNRRLDYDSQGRLITVKDPSGEQTLVSYRYDGHNHLVGVTQGNEREILRVYQGYNLSHTRQGTTVTQYLLHGDRPLGQQQVDDPTRTLLLMTDASPNVIGECLQSGVTTAVYSACGVRSSDEEMLCLLAFNCEVCEEITECYLLGRGYRVYNPNLMRFHSPDSFSPFGAGGMNPYTYCLGNPVTFRDPSGHRVTGRPEDPIYVDPVEQPGTSVWGKVGMIFNFVSSAILAVVAIIMTGGMATPFVVAAYIAALTVAVGVGVGVYGVITDKEDWYVMGTIVAGIGGIVSMGIGIAGYHSGKAPTPSPIKPTGGGGGSQRSSVSSMGSGPGGSTSNNPPSTPRFSTQSSNNQSSVYDADFGAYEQNPDLFYNNQRRHSSPEIPLPDYENSPTPTPTPTPAPTAPMKRRHSLPENGTIRNGYQRDGKGWKIVQPIKLVFTTDGFRK